MPDYVLGHELAGEKGRLALMSHLLDPMHRRHIRSLGIGPGARTLEVGCGNGSISVWLAECVAPDGHAVAVDLDLSLIDQAARKMGYRTVALSSSDATISTGSEIRSTRICLQGQSLL